MPRRGSHSCLYQFSMEPRSRAPVVYEHLSSVQRAVLHRISGFYRACSNLLLPPPFSPLSSIMVGGTDDIVLGD